MSICSIDISIKDHITATNFQTMAGNNPNLDLDSINANAKFGHILSISSQDIELNLILNNMSTSVKGHNYDV